MYTEHRLFARIDRPLDGSLPTVHNRKWGLTLHLWTDPQN